MPSRAQILLDILELEHIELNLYRGVHEPMTGGRLFGGQVLSQALSAANQTVEDDRFCHSLHGYFLRPGSPKVAVIYRVERIRDGKSFTTRRIVAIQNGEAIFSMDVSFQKTEQGLEHQIDMSGIPSPDTLTDDIEIAKRKDPSNTWATRERPYEMRSVFPMGSSREVGQENPVWLRFREPVTGGEKMHQLLLAYASDMGFVSTSFLPHYKEAKRNQVQMASLDHALWFHHPIDVQEWFVYIKDSTNAGLSRGFNRGAFYTETGKRVASSMQEGLMRVRT